ncbi:MAG: hypothetical protein HYY37_04935 [Candidatus Aenigmarchaeota archaeon]|nr:hypothetical protein [Candidatus Aenigmarchaeota archaeon]
MKGFAALYLFLSIFGVGIGLWVTWQGVTGNSLGGIALIAVGVFMVIKEILDIVH